MKIKRFSIENFAYFLQHKINCQNSQTISIKNQKICIINPFVILKLRIGADTRPTAIYYEALTRNMLGFV
jgi:hypothetical protein